MSFDVAAEAYGAFIGRYSETLAEVYAERLGARAGQRALDVGCGPGAMTAVLARRLGPDAVSAVEPSASFVAAAQSRLPGVDIRRAAAEALPFVDGEFDLTVAQLVVHFMPDPVRGLREMARVTRPGGLVSACVWDHAGGRSPLSAFWTAVTDLDPAATDESGLAGARAGHLLTLFREAGLPEAQETTLSVESAFAGFEEWWYPFTLGVGPAGDYLATLDADGRERLRARCAELVPSGPFTVSATVWTVLARV